MREGGQLEPSEASEKGVSPPNERSVCGAERSRAEQRVESKGDKEGEKVDAIASGMGRG